MINVANKAGLVSGYFKATSQVVASGLKPAAATVTSSEWVVGKPAKENLNSYSLGKIIPTGNLSITSGPTGIQLFGKSLWLLDVRENNLVT